jgi:methyl-accepting chemotaxis protein
LEKTKNMQKKSTKGAKSLEKLSHGIGETGKGFAVVADEVRKLAEESGKPTIKIKDIIEDIDESIDGVILNVTALGSNIKEIDKVKDSVVTSLEKILKITYGIVSNAEEQSAAIHGVSITIDELNQLVSTLEKLLNQFKL